MDTILQGIFGVHCYIDDILVTGPDDNTHIQHLQEVLKRLQHYSVCLKQSKCHFFKESVEFLGHCIDANGLHTTLFKIEAIQLAPRPTDQTQLRSFLGLVHYYGMFIHSLATMLQPLNHLLQAGQKWKWTGDCEWAFQQAKESLISHPCYLIMTPSYSYS